MYTYMCILVFVLYYLQQCDKYTDVVLQELGRVCVMYGDVCHHILLHNGRRDLVCDTGLHVGSHVSHVQLKA